MLYELFSNFWNYISCLSVTKKVWNLLFSIGEIIRIAIMNEIKYKTEIFVEFVRKINDNNH